MNAVAVRAFAKINLALEISGRRSDGYHEIVSVFQAVSLADDLTCCPSDRLSLATDPALPFPVESNLAFRAAQLLGEAAGGRLGAALTLRKRIPIAAGLGGGSADAAAAVIGLCRLWRLRLPLAPLAAQLGSDVPYFLGTATALVRGRGERLDSLPPLPTRPVVLLRPSVPLATRDVFAALQPEEWSDGATTLALARNLRNRAPLEERLLRNGLRAAAERCCPALAALRRSLGEHGVTAHLSGSGPTLFVLPASVADATAVAALGERLGAERWIGRTIGGRPIRASSVPIVARSKGA